MDLLRVVFSGFFLLASSSWPPYKTRRLVVATEDKPIVKTHSVDEFQEIRPEFQPAH